jgi:hypothetical protein
MVASATRQMDGEVETVGQKDSVCVCVCVYHDSVHSAKAVFILEFCIERACAVHV